MTARGVCWNTSSNPTTANSHTTDGSGTGTFVSSLTGLTPNTLYYLRAYAVNTSGTAYGDDVTFTTLTSTLNLGLISYWKIDETTGTVAYDAVSTNNCTVQTGVTINQSGLINKAALFVVTNNGLTTGKTASQLGIGGGASKSVSIWIKPDPSINLVNSGGIINLGTMANQQQFGIKIFGYWMFDSWYGAVRIAPDGEKLADGNWHHIVVTYNSDGHKLRTYLDGDFVTEDASKTLNTTDQMGFSIGIGSQENTLD